MVCAISVVSACSCSVAPQVVLRYEGGEDAVSYSARVHPDGSFSNLVRRADGAHIIWGTVHPETGRLYRVAFGEKNRKFVGRDGRFEYSSVTNSVMVLPNEKKTLVQMDKKSVTIELKTR